MFDPVNRWSPRAVQQETNVVHLLSWVALLMGDDEIVQFFFHIWISNFFSFFFFCLLEVYVAWSIKWDLVK